LDWPGAIFFYSAAAGWGSGYDFCDPVVSCIGLGEGAALGPRCTDFIPDIFRIKSDKLSIQPYFSFPCVPRLELLEKWRTLPLFLAKAITWDFPTTSLKHEYFSEYTKLNILATINR